MGHFVVLFFSHPGAIRLAILGFFVGHGGILSHPNNPLLALVFLLVNSPLIPGKTRVAGRERKGRVRINLLAHPTNAPAPSQVG